MTIALLGALLLLGTVPGRALSPDEARARIVALALGDTPASGPAVDLHLEVELKPGTAALGEPVLLRALIRNTGEPTTDSPGGGVHGYPNLTLHVTGTSPDGGELRNPMLRARMMVRQGGLGPYRWPKLEPGVWEEWELVQNYVALDRPGRYEITMEAHVELGGRPLLLSAPPVPLIVGDEVSIMTEAEAAERFAIMGHYAPFPAIVFALRDDPAGIENRLHHVLDRTFGEDARRSAQGAAPIRRARDTILRNLQLPGREAPCMPEKRIHIAAKPERIARLMGAAG